MNRYKTDVLVAGAGMGGMCAALFASQRGMRVLLCEKTEMVGGTTATSAGTVWIPGAFGDRPDEIPNAERYLDAEIGNRGNREMRSAFLQTCRQALSVLHEHTEVKFRPVRPHPDYHPASEGWSMAGHALGPVPFDGRLLGRDFELVRPPIEPFMVLGGLMIGRDDIEAFVNPFGSVRSLLHVAMKVSRHLADRLRYARGTQLIMGNALVARLLYSVRSRDIPLWTNCRLIDLRCDGGRVRGAIVEIDGEKIEVEAGKAIILATGGFSHSPILRGRLLPEAVRESVAFEGNSGDGIVLAQRIGAALSQTGDRAAFWMPVSVLEKGSSERTVYPHIVLDRAKPGLVAVNEKGARFTNEADSYHDFVDAMLRSKTAAAWLVCDSRFIRAYGLGLVRPGSSCRAIERFVDEGYLQRGNTLQELAKAIRVDADSLLQTIARHNGFAESGWDEDFGKGSNGYNRHNGDVENRPNPCLRPIADPPFFAVAVYPADLGTSAGIATNENGQVLDRSGKPMTGLYACGNDMNSIMSGTYPGPGTTLGPALVFAYRAARHIAGCP